MNPKIAIILIMMFFCSSGSFAQLHKIVFTPHWLPQAQFAGYYMAQQKGFYREEGLDVEIVHPSASVMATDELVNGKADVVSLFLVSALAAKSRGVDLVNIAQLSQNSALLFIVKKSSGIRTLADLNGKRIGIWESGFDEVPKALIYSNNYNVKWVPILSSINMFMMNGVDAMTAMWFNEYNEIINAGMDPDELSTLFFSDYGYNIPEDGLYCLNKTLLTKKDDLQKFVRGTLKGWEYAKNHKEETLQVVLDLMKKEHVPTNLAHQSWMLDKVFELIEPGQKNVKKGELAESDFNKTQNILLEGGYIKDRIPFNEFYKPVVLP
jgi:NitT/TauT family transport system substrate-binding protein